MNKEDAIYFLPLVQALIDGKTLQFKPFDHEWSDAPDKGVGFNFAANRYRIKPDPPIELELWYHPADKSISCLDDVDSDDDMIKWGWIKIKMRQVVEGEVR